jgi:amino acid transporter
MDAGESQARTFVRRSSGLVRDVSPTHALFFGVAAVFGGGMAFTFQGMTATGQPMWQFGFTWYAWSALFVAAIFVLLGIIYAILTSAMPRAGANYVFTSRILAPLPAWLESWCLLLAVVAVVATLLPLALLMLNLAGGVMAIAFPTSGLWDGAAGWFSTPDSQFIGGTVLVVLACLFAILPSKLFYRALTVLGILAVSTIVLMVIAVPFLSHDTFVSNLFDLTGQTPAAVIEAAPYPEGGFTFLGFMALCSFALFVFFGYQYSSFISGEMSGSVKRTTYISIMGTLALCAFVPTIYNDLWAHKFGVELTSSWAFAFWTGGEVPGGITASPATLGAIANPDIWPLWLMCAMVAALFTFLLMPVWFVVGSRIMFAWSMDRQAPQWLGRINARTNAPLNGIVVCAVTTELILYLTSYQDLALASSLWFSTLMFLPALIMPGVNALFARARRPDLFGDTAAKLPWIGAVWLVLIGLIAATAIFKPLYEGFTGDEESASSYLSSSGVLAALITLGAGLVLYFVNIAWNRSRGVERTKVFAAIPPD